MRRLLFIIRAGTTVLMSRYNFVHRKLMDKQMDVGFEVLTAVVMDVTIFWDIVLYSPYLNRSLGRSVASIPRV
jgi:hypothetical protein